MPQERPPLAAQVGAAWLGRGLQDMRPAPSKVIPPSGPTSPPPDMNGWPKWPSGSSASESDGHSRRVTGAFGPIDGVRDSGDRETLFQTLQMTANEHRNILCGSLLHTTKLVVFDSRGFQPTGRPQRATGPRLALAAACGFYRSCDGRFLIFPRPSRLRPTSKAVTAGRASTDFVAICAAVDGLEDLYSMLLASKNRGAAKDRHLS